MGNKLRRVYAWVMLSINIIGLFIILFAIYVYFTTNDPKDVEVINTNLKVYTVSDSLASKFTFDQILNHNSMVISTLQERESTAYNIRMSRESIIKQSRTIYIAILVVLLSLLFNKKREDIESNNKFILLIFAILVLYLVEVHSDDLLQRQDNCTEIIARSTEDIVNSAKFDSIWFNLDYCEYRFQIDQASEGSFCRKLMRAVHPDIEQLGIYIIPFLIIFISYFRITLKQVKSYYS